ncbi:MAG: hypothetical protein COA84_10105 [Robiginitomaculum sp.]|nr:MAG: hypothetical protein COA84_10105 [Robiginitomaculum sp.]
MIQKTSISILALSLAVFIGTPALANGGGKNKEKAVAEKSAFGVMKASAGSENFLVFYPSAATIFAGYKPMGLMHFEYGLEIKDDNDRERAAKLAPRLREAYARLLAQYAGSLYTPGEVPDIEYLSARMQSATDRIIGKGKAQFLVSTLMVNDH